MDEKKIPNLATPVAVILAGLIIAGAVIYGNYNDNPSISEGTDGFIAKKFIPIDETDHVRGNAIAKLAVVEYSDLECPYCKIFHQTMNEIIATDGTTIAWSYRHFPIDSLHQKAYSEAVASECATMLGGHSAFWKFIDEVFAVTPSNDGLDPAELPKIAQKIGLDVGKFSTCLKDEATKSRVNADYDSGIAIGVDGTPFVLIAVKNGPAYPIFQIEPASIEDKAARDLAEKVIAAYSENIKKAQGK
ncbi:MAG: Thioredoxin-like fold protein [Patescibacteria group bacterium]|nr:Thioredoxin-like fold protein [Patescibacteria group bacterium]